MKPIVGYSIAIPHTGERIEIVEFAGDLIRSVGPLASVIGPFRFCPHDAYECIHSSGEDVVIYHLQPGEVLDAEEQGVCYLFTGTWPITSLRSFP